MQSSSSLCTGWAPYPAVVEEQNTSSVARDRTVAIHKQTIRSEHPMNISLLVFRAASLRYRISCESYSKTMALLLFGGLQGNLFGLRCSWLLFYLYCCTLRTFATEAVGKLATIIRVNLGVVLGS